MGKWSKTSKKCDWIDSHEKFVKRMNEIKPDFEILGTWNGSQTDIEFIHKPCGTKVKQTPNNMLDEDYGGCPVCGDRKRSETQRAKYGLGLKDIVNALDEHYPNEFELIPGQTYINNKQKIKFIHKPCGCIVEKSLVNARTGRGCSECRKFNIEKSKGCIKIEQFLTKHQISFEKEISYEDLRYIRQLSFDYLVHLPNKDLYIEYDGERHFSTFNKDISEVYTQQERDFVKNQYCIDKKLNLLRISYKDIKNIDKILENIIINGSTTSSFNGAYIISEGIITEKNGLYLKQTGNTQMSENNKNPNKD